MTLLLQTGGRQAVNKTLNNKTDGFIQYLGNGLEIARCRLGS